MLNLLFAFIGFLGGGMLNVLADDLPRKKGVHRPRCPHCGYEYGPAGWLGTGRLLLQRGRCPQCERPVRRRAPLVEWVTALLFAYLPVVFERPEDLFFVALYVAVLVLVIVIDLEHRLILHVVTFPTTGLALLGSFFVSFTNPIWSVVGMITGFVVFFLFYLLGQKLFGPGALGFGDVTLSMTMGAMLGFPFIVFALVFGILIGGVISLALVLSRTRSRRSYIPYGPFLALGGMIMVVWGAQIVRWYIS